MEFLFLSERFYSDYSKCFEIEQKFLRPYAQVYTKINGIQFAIPLRSGLTRNNHVLWTDKKNNSGLDFSKAVIVFDENYIDKTKKPHIRQNEFDSLRGKEYIIKKKMIKHILDYNEAKENLDISRNKNLCEFSTMQYFEQHIENIGKENTISA